MGEPRKVDGPENPVPGWEAWTIQVSLGTMPDGTVAATGLRIEPRIDYQGSIGDQRITLERLRQFPIGAVTQRARFAAGESESGHVWVDLPSGAGLEHALQVFVVLAEDNTREKARQQMELWQRERGAGGTKHGFRVVRSAKLYNEALRHPSITSPRRFVADVLGVSLTTVDRLLREARQIGILPPYHGAQGKHGKTNAHTTIDDAGPSHAAVDSECELSDGLEDALTTWRGGT